MLNQGFNREYIRDPVSSNRVLNELLLLKKLQNSPHLRWEATRPETSADWGSCWRAPFKWIVRACYLLHHSCYLQMSCADTEEEREEVWVVDPEELPSSGMFPRGLGGCGAPWCRLGEVRPREVGPGSQVRRVPSLRACTLAHVLKHTFYLSLSSVTLSLSSKMQRFCSILHGLWSFKRTLLQKQ